jgi:hypothetical protein
MVRQLLDANHNDWEESFYQRLGIQLWAENQCRHFFFRWHLLPLQVIRKHRDSRLQVEALFYGQAGMLQPKMKDAYARDPVQGIPVSPFEIQVGSR